MSKVIKFTFYVVGTLLLLFSSIVVGANFYKDSGVFDKAVVEVKKQTPQKVAEASPSTNKKIIVETEPVEEEPAKETAAVTTAETTVNNDKLAIEVINCTGKSGLAEDTRIMLEAKGFTVSTGSGKEVQGKSQIIIRKKGAKADVIKSTLKISPVAEQLQPKSRFDITVIIGKDFNP